MIKMKKVKIKIRIIIVIIIIIIKIIIIKLVVEIITVKNKKKLIAIQIGVLFIWMSRKIFISALFYKEYFSVTKERPRFGQRTEDKRKKQDVKIYY